ncbi:MAG TPA: pilus assembly protein N-terminal domain-containing protein [Longimicrobiales bacterium]|nr:pilus assembly protein N-terminal domain-containing protein [Longimicrobiales bacterium]
MTGNARARARTGSGGWWMGGVALLLAFSGWTAPVAGQIVRPAGSVVIPVGQSELLVQPVAVERVSIGNPEIANATVVSPQEVLVDGIALGTTTLIIWDRNGGRRSYTVEVTVDATALRRTVEALFPNENVTVTAVGNMVILAGNVRDARVARQIQSIAEGTGAIVVSNLDMAADQQVMLQVRIAEVSRSAVRELASDLAARNPQNVSGRDSDWVIETISDGLMRLLIMDPGASLEAVFRALRTTGEIRTLAEPNLIAVDGAEASFLAGGEFPFPVAQSGGDIGRVTIEWREFGVRLNFRPVITAGGAIRLQVAPEVSSLDFSTGLVIGGFAVPTLLMRRANTEIELMEGQTFAIAGLLDNTSSETITRLPILGSLPIIGSLFQSRRRLEDQMELLVLVTPYLVSPYDTAPPVPPGEVDTWRRDGHLRPTPPHPMPPPARTGGGGNGGGDLD